MGEAGESLEVARADVLDVLIADDEMCGVAGALTEFRGVQQHTFFSAGDCEAVDFARARAWFESGSGRRNVAAAWIRASA